MLKKGLPAIILSLSLAIACRGGLSSEARSAARDSVDTLGKLKAATEVGVNYQQYGILLIDAKAKVNDACSKLSPSELRTAIQGAMDLYEVASTAWSSCLDGALCERVKISGLADLYKIPTYSNIAGVDYISRGSLLSKIWDEANGHVDRANVLLK